MNRRELARRLLAVGGGLAAGAGIARLAQAVEPPKPRTFAVRLPVDAQVGSAVTLIRVASGWIVVPYGCTAAKVES